MHFLEENLKLYVLGRLSYAQSAAINLHISECRACEDMLAEVTTHLQRSPQPRDDPEELNVNERRREVRIPTDEPASIEVLLSRRAELTGRIVDASRGGLKLRLPVFLESGTLVQVRLKNSLVRGEVRHCTQIGTEFYAGVKVQDVLWTAGKEGSD